VKLLVGGQEPEVKKEQEAIGLTVPSILDHEVVAVNL
jgi:hypothetical protein